MIELINVSKKYKDGTRALHDVSLKINDGEFVYIMGPTGSGKTTLVKLLDGEEVPNSGKVMVSGVNVGRLRKSRVYLYRRKIGVVFQDYRLLPEKTVFENVAYALEILDTPRDKLRKRVREVLKMVDLSDKSNSKPDQLSGGQKQRTAIARALAKWPMIIIADEPTGNLDPDMTDEMISLLEKINKEEKTTIIVVTHEISTVRKHPKRTIRIEAGHVVSDTFGVKDPVVKADVTEEKEETASETEIKEESVKEETVTETVEEEATAEEETTVIEETVPETVIEEPVVEENTAETVNEETDEEETAVPETVVEETSEAEPVQEETPVTEPEQKEAVVREETVTPIEDTISVGFNTEAAVPETEEEDSYEAIKRRIETSLAQARILVEQEDLLIEDYTGTTPVLNEETGVTFPLNKNAEDKS
ncbi:MAG: ATP-binding cassette domain-containing protein [Erysipelotrichaceae bacterium]|nr:ATP-binding cassette domain-containing protein [Erysipelotrichaceae bacterium]